MRYSVSPPSPQLRNVIRFFWSLEQSADEAAGSREPVLPDGCPEIVFNLGDPFRKFGSNNTYERQPRILVAGQMTQHIVIGPSGNVRLFGVRFQPTGAFAFLGFPSSELTDQIVDFADLSNDTELVERLEEASGFPDLAAVFEATIAKALVRSGSVDPKLTGAANRLCAFPGKSTIARTAAELGWSERKLERDFKRFVGLSPKTFARVMRFAGVVRGLETTGPSELMDHVHRYGYYDQSHMINEFRAFAGESPTAFYDRSHRLSELFTVGE